MKRIIVASNNQHKIDEIKSILSAYGLEILSLKEAGIDVEVEEDGTTFMQNAYKKAREIYNIVQDCMVLADDSGLMVDFLGGAPGVYSARFSGEHGNTKKNNAKLLSLLENKALTEKSAKFVCAVVLIIDENNIIKVQGEVNGFIIDEERGSRGFGYDPLFYVPEYGMTFGEMDDKLKNQISHRGKALEKLKEEFEKVTQGE